MKPTEYEFTLKDGSKRYEIIFTLAEIHAFVRLHNAITAKPVRSDDNGK